MITNEDEAYEARNKLFDLEQEIKKISKPLEKYIEECDRKNRKEKWEHKTFHSPKKGGTFIYVKEVNDYNVECITVKSWYFTEHRIEIVLDESFSHEEMENVSEWKGIGQSFHGEMVKVLETLQTHLIDNNKSIKL